MKDDTQPEALAALIERFRGLHIDHKPDGWPAVRTREITALLDRIAELEAQLEAIGACGVSALMGAAKAGSEPVAWAIFAEGGNIRLWSKKPLLHPSAQPLYTHPSPTEGMAVTDAMIDAGKKMLHNSNGRGVREKVERIFNAMIAVAPPTAQAEGWRLIATAPKDGTYLLLWEHYSTNPFVGCWAFGAWTVSHEHVDAEGGWDGANVVDALSMPITHWMPIPAPPTSAEGVEP